MTTGEGIERITNIVESLKGFTRLDEAEYQRTDLHAGLESTLALLEHETRDRITLFRDYGDLPPIYCYPGEMNQVFMSVLVNAVQAIEGSGEIGIRTYCDGPHARIDISDTGRGIEPDRLPRIFDPDFSRKDDRVGLGMGLATSYNIVRRNNGYLDLQSEPGKGTVVTIALPLEPASDAAT